MKRPRAAGIMARAGAVPFWGLLGAVLAIPLLAGPAGRSNRRLQLPCGRSKRFWPRRRSGRPPNGR